METPERGTGQIIFMPSGNPSGTVARRPSSTREQYAGWWLLSKKTTNTREAYRRDITSFFAWCDEFDFDVFTIRRPHLDGYREYLTNHRTEGRPTYTDTTVARKLSAVASFYTYLTDEAPRLVPSNPARKVQRPDLPTDSTTESLDPDEAGRLVAVADETGPRESALVRLLDADGLRVSEVCAADVTDLGRDRQHRTITVIRKGGKRQRLPIPTNAATAIDRYVAGRRTGPLFLSSRGGRMTRQQVYYVLGKLGRRAGIEKKVTPHVIRHTSGTAALDAGATLRDVQTLLGHIDPRTTNRYDRTRHNLDRSPVHQLDRPLVEAADVDRG
jgi:integrase/recombinase XerD